MSSSSVAGIGILLISLICLGTWPALLRLCSNSGDGAGVFCGGSPTQRHPCHAYLDYSFSYVISSLLPVLLWLIGQETTGSISAPLVFISMLGGALLSLGNVSMQWATSVYGAPLTTVLALQAGMTVVLGTFINYELQPERTAHVHLLIAGVVLFLLAIGLAGRAQVMYHGRRQLQSKESYEPCGEIELEVHHQQRYGEPVVNPSHEFHSQHNNVPRGLAIAIAGGLCFGFFSPCFNVAVNAPFGWTVQPLSVPTANLFFGIAFGLCSAVANVLLMTCPPRVDGHFVVPPSSLNDYLSSSERRLAFAAGFVCALGNVLQFQGGQLAGFAAADLVQAFPLVATVWDVVLFGEFRPASSRVLLILVGMYLSYIGGIVLLGASIAE